MRAARKIGFTAVGVAALLLAGPGLASAGGNAPGTHHSYAPSSASPRHRLVLTHPVRAFETHPLARGTKLGTTESNNWSGYAAYGDHFRYVKATYTIPSLNCAVSPDGSFDSEWIGLDGYTTNTVEQVGDYATCSGGTPYYYAFYEMYPLGSVAYSGVSPGDSVTVSVYYSNSQWRLEFYDNTEQSGFTQYESCPSGSTCENANAEVISEVPNGGPPSAELADYGIVGFTQIGITDYAGHHDNFFSAYWKHDEIFEYDLSNGDLMQAPGALEGSESGSGGGWGNQAFTDTAVSSG
jgi:hypothetical protein